MKLVKVLLFIIWLVPITNLFAQITFTDAERKTGYALREDTTWFVFDPGYYKKASVEKVVVTGSFRGWSQDLDDVTYHLKNYQSY